MPIVLNQDNVFLDGHHRLRACKELGIPVSYSIKDFTGKPLDELKYVVSINLHRRHLDEFQRAEIALKYDKIYRKIARSRYDASHFTSETGRAAINKRWDEEQNNGFSDDEGAAGDEGGDGDGISGHKGSQTRQELAEQFGVSTSTLDRVDTILQDGTPEQVQSEKLKDKLSSQQTENPAQLPTGQPQAHQQGLSHYHSRGHSRWISRPCIGFGFP